MNQTKLEKNEKRLKGKFPLFWCYLNVHSYRHWNCKCILTNEQILENICSSLLRAGVNFTKLFLQAKRRRRTAENLPFNFTNNVKVTSTQNSPNLCAIRQMCSPKKSSNFARKFFFAKMCWWNRPHESLSPTFSKLYFNNSLNADFVSTLFWQKRFGVKSFL